jgi:large subunit ribosomal protein L28
MSKICQITGKRAMVGNNVSHSKRRSKRTFMPNLFIKRFFLEDENRWITIKVSAAGIKDITKKGLVQALKDAQASGFISKY